MDLVGIARRKDELSNEIVARGGLGLRLNTEGVQPLAVLGHIDEPRLMPAVPSSGTTRSGTYPRRVP